MKTTAGSGPGGWTNAEAEILARAVRRAPSGHDTHPWAVEAVAGAVLLRERADVALPRHDPGRRGLAMACGAALADLELAVRALGRSADVVVLPDPDSPDVVARIGTRAWMPPSEVELQRFAAIATRRGHRSRFTGLPVGFPRAARVARAGATTGAEAVPRPDAGELAALFDHAARVRGDGAYQRAPWTIRRAGRHAPVVAGGELPWAAPVVPSRPAGETFVLVLTAGDGRVDHVRAGLVLERCRLEAIRLGLSTSELTQPLSALCRDQDLPGFPQALLRLGRTPRGAPAGVRRAALVGHGSAP
ncbi:Acg family FMN-binding oxidoreductase [Amycolatopsis sp. NPDC004368]